MRATKDDGLVGSKSARALDKRSFTIPPTLHDGPSLEGHEQRYVYIQLTTPLTHGHLHGTTICVTSHQCGNASYHPGDLNDLKEKLRDVTWQLQERKEANKHLKTENQRLQTRIRRYEEQLTIHGGTSSIRRPNTGLSRPVSASGVCYIVWSAVTKPLTWLGFMYGPGCKVLCQRLLVIAKVQATRNARLSPTNPSMSLCQERKCRRVIIHASLPMIYAKGPSQKLPISPFACLQ